ncbi:MAG: hypothetical protein NT029_19390 [Armatimonadetes bacterium]|nr:hypothetical protein [Armatimonadota bacterium]
MTTLEATIARIRTLPDPLVQEVGDYVDFLVTRHSANRWEAWQGFEESVQLAERGLDHYLADLVSYEDRLARGDVRW